MTRCDGKSSASLRPHAATSAYGRVRRVDLDEEVLGARAGDEGEACDMGGEVRGRRSGLHAVCGGGQPAQDVVRVGNMDGKRNMSAT
jgi:hypothetical protein